MCSKALATLLAAASAVSVAGLTITKKVNRTGEAAPVFYGIFMGDFAKHHQSRLWLSSLRTVGKWQGTVMIATDQPECMASTLGEELLGGAKDAAESDEAVHIYPGAGANGKVYIVAGSKTEYAPGSFEARKEYKQQKQMVWEHVEQAKVNHPISSVIYTDEDIVFGKDLTNAVADIKATEAKNYSLSLFADKGFSVGELHTGIVVSYPTEKSKNCLAAWKKTLKKAPQGTHHNLKQTSTLIKSQTESAGVDQQSLGRTKECKGHHELKAKYLLMPDTESCKSGKKGEFVHFTNTKRAKEISHSSQKTFFYKHLGLDKKLDVFGETDCGY